MSKKIMVAMSGGVDSSVAALLLKDAGFEVVGVTMCFSLPSGPKRRPSCCGIEGVEDAKRVAGQLGIPHYVLNFSKELEEIVVLDFIVEYISGRTPNPCVRCNQYLKFASLLKKAKALGAGHLATGHFARVQKKGRSFLLKKGIDPIKDQSYFLCQVGPRELPCVRFPVGDMTKAGVRAIAKKRGLAVADKPASQEVCFIPDDDYRAFLRQRLNKAYFKAGAIVDGCGKVLGHHRGIFDFTIGQREGLKICAPHPLYVLALDALRNRVIVGKKENVYKKGLVAIEPNIFLKGILASAPAKKSVRLKAKIRYNHREADARVRLLTADKIAVDFDAPQAAITPGQFVVLYKGDVVAAAAKIIKSL